MLAKVLNLDADSFDFLQQSGSTGALFTLFDAITDLWAVTWFSSTKGRPFVFVVDNVEWLLNGSTIITSKSNSNLTNLHMNEI